MNLFFLQEVTNATRSYKMNISSAQYTKNSENRVLGIKVVIDNQTHHVPINEGNRHYQAIQEWVAKGNKIEDAD